MECYGVAESVRFQKGDSKVLKKLELATVMT